MPELPEVETIMQGLKPHIEHNVIQSVVIRNRQLRWPINSHLENYLIGQKIDNLWRRAKYLIMPVKIGALLIHLGMSGRLQIVPIQTIAQRHDHVDFIFNNCNYILRYTDPRRFGAMIWTTDSVTQHPLLRNLGPEPLGNQFTIYYLQDVIKTHRIAIKSLLMNSNIVAGIGNIYATEALFLAKIHPATPANRLNTTDCELLVLAIQKVLRFAIQQGGTTIKDFTNIEGKPGYFVNALQVYGRAGLACFRCGGMLQSIRLAQRSTVFCSSCQKNK